MRWSMLIRSLVLCGGLGLTGCGKIPTWGELSGQAPAPAPAVPTAVTPQPAVQTVQAVQPSPPSSAEVIARFQSLRSADISDTEMRILTSLNEGLEAVTEINVTGSPITNNALDSIEKLTNLQQLRLTATRVTNDACDKLALLSSLEILSLTDTAISDVGVAKISALPNLKQLELTHCRLTENGWAAVGNLPSLKSLIVDGCGLDGAKLALICNAKTLTQLTMPRNPLNDFALPALQKLADLEYLEVGETQVTGMGLAFAQKGGLKHLKFLGMYACPLNAQGAKAISSVKSLERLSLGNISILNDDDVASIVQSMKNLKYVYLAQCTNLNGSFLLKLKQCKDLEELHINQCANIGDPAVGVLRTFKSLKLLSTNGTAITPRGIAELKSSLPDCTIQ